MATHTYWIERCGEDIPVFVDYEFTPPRRATQYDPPEGGVEITRVYCEVAITAREADCAEQSAVECAYEAYNERTTHQRERDYE